MGASDTRLNRSSVWVENPALFVTQKAVLEDLGRSSFREALVLKLIGGEGFSVGVVPFPAIHARDAGPAFVVRLMVRTLGAGASRVY
ncbi:hypothetical protein [Mycobacteroides abscessus]|uniref:hypothetical protein n=1 Tax=Mycobacteroides abscessus TaxID=36809 RepID=UPI000DD6F1E1|nr:hypothetical protein [Mycobacteroides abscessus]